VRTNEGKWFGLQPAGTPWFVPKKNRRIFMTFQKLTSVFAICLALGFGCGSVEAAAKAGETVLHTFMGLDGEYVVSGLIVGATGNIYGTARNGGGTSCVDYWTSGTVGCGVIFELTPPVGSETSWTEHTLHTFTGGADGAFPETLLLGDGVLYGTTASGGPGAKSGSGSGVLFELVAPKVAGGAWIEEVLHNFCGEHNCVDGAAPGDGLLLSKGSLFGTTAYGGANGNGTVFKYTLATSTAPEEFASLYSFKGFSDGAFPFYGVVSDVNGILFGVTYAGGGTGCANKNGCGVVYELKPTLGGGSYEEEVIYAFQGEPDGAQPAGRLLMLPKPVGSYQLVGVAGGGGDANYGAIFQLTNNGGPNGPAWTEQILTDFGIPDMDPPDSSYPNGNLVLASDGSIWGTTWGGGDTDTQLGFFYPGTIFQLQKPSQGNGQWSRNNRYSFQGGTDGVLPAWGLISGPNNSFYGTTSAGGSFSCPAQKDIGCGTVFQFVPF
jgi:uncharacterized repeat protein (TIGR03803 family)